MLAAPGNRKYLSNVHISTQLRRSDINAIIIACLLVEVPRFTLVKDKVKAIIIIYYLVLDGYGILAIVVMNSITKRLHSCHR